MLSPEVTNHKYSFLDKEKSLEDFTSEEVVEAFRKTVEIRNQMGGSLHFNILNGECHMLYDICRDKGTDEAIMDELSKDLEEYR